MRILALDVGDSRIGVAISDELQIIASKLLVVTRSDILSDVRQIEKLCDSNDIEKVIVGLPITLRGKVGIQGQKVLEFTQALKEALSLPVVSWDERFTTVEANRILRESNVSAKRRKKSVDSIAASFILESYLERIRSDKPKAQVDDRLDGD